MKKPILLIIILSLILSPISCSKIDLGIDLESDLGKDLIVTDKEVTIDDNIMTVDIESGDSLFGMDLSDYDLSNSKEILSRVNFSTETIFPDRDRLPDDFVPQNILEWGNNLTLNINSLHNKGITGKGVNIAYVDQPILINHEEYVNKNIHYEKIREEGNEAGFKSSMHGGAVTSILLGENLGVAPDVNLYYLGNPSWINDQITRAEAVYRIIEINKTLAKDERIKIIGFSNAPSRDIVHYKEFVDALDEAKANGIMVFTVDDNFLSAKIEPYMDRDDYKNYKVADWLADNYGVNKSFSSNDIFVPTSITTAGYDKSNSHIFHHEGGISWVIPYVVGVSALGLQVDPTLTKEEILNYLVESAYLHDGIKIINPQGFIDLVISNLDKSIPLDNILNNYEDVKPISNLKQLIEEEKIAGEKFLSSIPQVKSNNSDMISYIDDGYSYEKLDCFTSLDNKEIQIDRVGVAYEDNYVNIKIKAKLPKKDILTVCLQKDMPGLKIQDEGLEIGDNIIILKIDKEELISFDSGLMITLGDGNFIFIEKDLLDIIASK